MRKISFVSFEFAGTGFPKGFSGSSVAFHLWHNTPYRYLFLPLLF